MTVKQGYIFRLPQNGKYGVIRGNDGKDRYFGTGDIRDTEIELGMTSIFNQIAALEKVNYIILPNGKAKIVGFPGRSKRSRF